MKKTAVGLWNDTLVPFINFLWKGLGMIASIQPWDLFISGIQVALEGVAWLMEMMSNIPGFGSLAGWAATISGMAGSLEAIQMSSYVGSGNIVGPIPMAAAGGLFKSPTAAIIGERGPEIVIPARPASEIMRGSDYTPYNKLGIGSNNSDLKNEINRLSATVSTLASAVQNMDVYMSGQKVGGVVAREALNPKLG
jgi:hypothetical protein